MDTKARLKALIVSSLHLPIEPGTIEDAAPLFGDGLGLDSIDALELMIGVEQEFGVELPETEATIKTFGSVNALAAFVDAGMVARA